MPAYNSRRPLQRRREKPARRQRYIVNGEGKGKSDEEMRGDEAEEVAGSDDFRIHPKAGKVAGVSGNEVIGASRIGTFKKDVVVRIGGDLKTRAGTNAMGALFNELQQLLTGTFANLEFRAREHIPIFRKDRG